MKTIATLSALTLSIILATQAHAMPFGKGQCDSEERATKLLEKFDGNSDGSITLDELQQVRAAHFVAIDTDNSGDLTDTEMQAYKEVMRESRMQERFTTNDADGNGVLSLEEFQQDRGDRAERRFNRLDSNADGALTFEEMTTAMQGRNKGKKYNRHFQRLDTDGNSVISQEEFMYSVPLFDRFDSDSDGIITQEEIKAQGCQGRGRGHGHRGY